MPEPSAKPPPPPPRVGEHLDAVNGTFHEAYDAARDRAENAAPVMVVLADKLVVVKGGERREWLVTPELFHVIKSAAHGPVALFSRLVGQEEARSDAATETWLVTLRDHIAGALTRVHGDDPEAVDAVRAVLAFTLQLLETSDRSRSALGTFARAMGPRLLDLTVHATRIQLRALDERVAEALASLSREEQHSPRSAVPLRAQFRIRRLRSTQHERRLANRTR